MCAECLTTPCHPRCPNAKEPKPIHTCIECKDGIYAGDKFLTTEKGTVCEDCLRDMSGTDLLELMGERLEEAKDE